MRPGKPVSIRSPILNTTPLLAASTVAVSTDSAPVVGWVFTTRTVRPTYFSSSLAGVSRSKSKFCSIRVSAPGCDRLRSCAVSGRMRPLTSRSARRFGPASSVTRRVSFTSARFSL